MPAASAEQLPIVIEGDSIRLADSNFEIQHPHLNNKDSIKLTGEHPRLDVLLFITVNARNPELRSWLKKQNSADAQFFIRVLRVLEVGPLYHPTYGLGSVVCPNAMLSIYCQLSGEPLVRQFPARVQPPHTHQELLVSHQVIPLLVQLGWIILKK